MPSKEDGNAWDLTPVLDLLQSISSISNPSEPSYQGHGLAATTEPKTEEAGGISLGNFDQLWDYLGVPRTTVTNHKPSFEGSAAISGGNRDAYASDGALYYPPSSKAVKWRDEEAGQELAETQPESPPSPSLGLSKSKKKKLRRKARKAEAAKLSDQPLQGFVAASSESEAEEPGRTRSGKIYSPASTKTASNTIAQNKAGKLNAESSADDAGFTPKSKANSQISSPSPATLGWLNRSSQIKPMPKAASQSQPQQTNKEIGSKQTPVTDRVAEAVDRLASAMSSGPSTPQKPAVNTLHQSLQKQHNLRSGVPKHVFHSPNGPPMATTKQYHKVIKPPEQQADLSAFPVIQKQPSDFRHEILPLEIRSSDDRNWTLLLKLLRNFPEERKHLLSPLQLTINRQQPNGIHVFVDASNILIGFKEHLRHARGIPQDAYISNVYPSFHALALLLERRRPVAKRVLAGSTPEVAAFEEARQVGYETCILDKVWKAKELTEKQRRIAVRNSRSHNGYSSTGDASDEYISEDGAMQRLQQQKPRWVEQAVDEILHLKILESIVDTPIVVAGEGPTMVLATGDAAEAEYSSGFLKMVERALKQGWRVEVMAWGSTVSYDYRKLERSSKWGQRFKIVELDEYAEELFSETG